MSEVVKLNFRMKNVPIRWPKAVEHIYIFSNTLCDEHDEPCLAWTTFYFSIIKPYEGFDKINIFTLMLIVMYNSYDYTEKFDICRSLKSVLWSQKQIKVSNENSFVQIASF